MDATLQAHLAAMTQGPVAVVFDPDEVGEIEVFVEGGLDISFIRGQEEQQTDILGLYDLYSSGDGAEFEGVFPESSIDVVNVVFADQPVSAPTYRGFGSSAGRSARATAVGVRIRPWQTKDSDLHQIEFWVVVPSGDAASRNSKTEAHAFTQGFKALPDASQEDGLLIGKLTYPARS